MIKTLKFSFYRVVVPGEDGTVFTDLLSEIARFDGEDRVYEEGGTPIRLQSFNLRHGLVTGDVARIRMTDIPEKMRLSGETEEIILDDDQGLGETSSFVYHPATGVLAYLRNRSSVSAAGFAHYVEVLNDYPDPIILEPVFEEAAYQRFLRMGHIQRCELKVAAPGNSQIFQDLGLTPREMVNLMGVAPKVTVTCGISMGHTRGRFPFDPVNRLVESIMNRRTQEAEDTSIKLEIAGREDVDEERLVIDLFDDHMTEKVEVDLGQGRRITDRHKINAARDAWRSRQNEIQRMFGNGGD